MEYRRFGNKLVVRIDRGEELCAKVLELAERENIRLAGVSGIGASDDITLGVFNTVTKTYSSTRYQGAYELASVTGNLSRQDGKPYLHLHAVIGNTELYNDADSRQIREPGMCFGGHLNAAVISATCELVIDVIDGEIGRKFSDEIGLNLYEF